MQNAFLVLGMHRGGTSAITGALPHFGVRLSSDLTPGGIRNPKGYFESQAVNAYMERLLGACGSFWHDWRPLVMDDSVRNEVEDIRNELISLMRREFADAPAYAVKDPRNCRAVSFWGDVLVRADARPIYLIIIRHPVAVAASLFSRNSMSFDKALLLWLRHMLDAERQTRSLPRVFVNFDQLVATWPVTMGRIGKLVGEDWEQQSARQRDALAEHFEESLLHHRPDQNSIKAMNDVGPWFGAMWNILSSYAEEGNSHSASKDIDAIDDGMVEVIRPFSVYFGDMERNISKTQAELKRLRGKIAVLREKAKRSA